MSINLRSDFRETGRANRDQLPLKVGRCEGCDQPFYLHGSGLLVMGIILAIILWGFHIQRMEGAYDKGYAVGYSNGRVVNCTR